MTNLHTRLDFSVFHQSLYSTNEIRVRVLAFYNAPEKNSFQGSRSKLLFLVERLCFLKEHDGEQDIPHLPSSVWLSTREVHARLHRNGLNLETRTLVSLDKHFGNPTRQSWINCIRTTRWSEQESSRKRWVWRCWVNPWISKGKCVLPHWQATTFSFVHVPFKWPKSSTFFSFCFFIITFFFSNFSFALLKIDHDKRVRITFTPTYSNVAHHTLRREMDRTAGNVNNFGKNWTHCNFAFDFRLLISIFPSGCSSTSTFRRKTRLLFWKIPFLLKIWTKQLPIQFLSEIIPHKPNIQRSQETMMIPKDRADTHGFHFSWLCTSNFPFKKCHTAVNTWYFSSNLTLFMVFWVTLSILLKKARSVSIAPCSNFG